MTTTLRIAPRRTARLHLLWGSVAALVFLVGCTTPEKRESAARTGAQDDQQQQQTRAAPRHSKPIESVRTASPKAPNARAEEDSSEGQILVDQIRQTVEDRRAQRQKELAARAAERQKAKGSTGRRDSESAVTARADEKAALTPAKREGEQAAGKKDSGSCGDKRPRRSLKPPPLDQPQPSFFCAQPTVASGDVWKGEKATFVWEVSNKGEGPLQIQIKKG